MTGYLLSATNAFCDQIYTAHVQISGLKTNQISKNVNKQLIDNQNADVKGGYLFFGRVMLGYYHWLCLSH